MKTHTDRPADDEAQDARSLPPTPASDAADAERPRVIPRRRGWRLPPAPR